MSKPNKTKVLAVVDYYLPGYKGGGPAVSVSRLIKCLGDECDFSVFTRDRDLGDEKPYQDIEPNRWTKKDDVQVFYASPKKLNLFGLMKAIRESQPDVIYLNSYFSKLTRSALLLRAVGLLKNTPILISPRGEFSPGALQLKSLKKRKYLDIANASRLHSGITWQVSSCHELNDTKAVVKTQADFFMRPPDIADRSNVTIETIRAEKLAGVAVFSFISRISPKKNLLGAIEMLQTITGQVTFAIYGPIEDQAYWQKCEEAIAALPKNISCVYQGGIPSSQVLEVLSAHHFFLFPTLGENFGHVIPEALAAGCPVLVSDQTPWLDFNEREVGWVTRLDDLAGWKKVIQNCVDMSPEQFETMSVAAKDYINAMARASSDLETNRMLFAVTIENQRSHAA